MQSLTLPFRQSAALAENGRTYPYDGSTFFDGDFKISGHAHGKFRSTPGRKEVFSGKRFGRFPQLDEIGPRFFRIGEERRHCHETGWPQHREFFYLQEQVFRFIYGNTRFLPLAADIYLDENRQDFL